MSGTVTENDYKALCEACDKLLLASDATVERIAIPWLNVIRPHPFFLKQYDSIFKPNHEHVSKVILGVRYIVINLRNLFSSALRNRRPQISNFISSKHCDILFISHLVNVSQVKKEDDNYFGDVPMKLVELGVDVVVGLLNHTGDKKVAMDDRWLDLKAPRVVFDSVIGVSQEWGLLKRVFREALRLNARMTRRASDLDRRVTSRAMIEAFSDGTLFALRTGAQVKNLVKRTRASVIIITAEGHSWERVVIHAAREASPNIICIAYQHSVLFRFQHSLQRSISSTFNPDRIFASGIASKRILGESMRLNDEQILTFGSNRCFALESRSADPKKSNENGICLVLPEGIVSECRLLFGCALCCARATPSLKFIFRLHPCHSNRDLIRTLPELKNIPDNISFSSHTLLEDIRAADWALYRGSTAIVQAVVGGVLPIYLKQADEITIDPLHELAALRVEVSGQEELRNFLLKKEGFSIHNDQLREYSKEIFTPFDLSALTRFLIKAPKSPL